MRPNDKEEDVGGWQAENASLSLRKKEKGEKGGESNYEKGKEDEREIVKSSEKGGGESVGERE